jgi:signal transduction histidine kinase
MKRLLSGLAGWLVALSLWAAGPVAVESPSRGLQSLAGHLEILEGPAGATLDEVLQAANRGKFKPIAGTLPAFKVRGEVWIRFVLRVPEGAPPEAWLEIKPISLEEITCFAPQEGAGYHATTVGTGHPFAARPIAHRTAVFRIGGPGQQLPGPTATIYLRVRTQSALLLEPMLWSPVDFQKIVSRDAFYFGSWYGITLLLLGMNLLNWWRLRGTLLLTYLGYLASAILLIGVEKGLASQFLFPASPRVAALVGQLALSALPCLFVAIFFGLLEFSRVRRWLEQGYRFLSYGLTLLGIGATLAGRFDAVALPLKVAIVLIVLANFSFTLELALRKNRLAWFYLLALVPFLLIAPFGLQQAPVGFLGEHALDLAVLVHLGLMNFPLALKLGQIKQERNQILAMALEASERQNKELNLRLDAGTQALQKEQERATRALDRERLGVSEQRQFLSMVSHEFRAPLAAIDEAAVVARVAAEVAPADVPLHTNTIQRDAQRLLNLIDTWLTLDHMAMGLWIQRTESVQLREFLEEIIQRSRERAPEREIRGSFDHLPATFACDPDLLGTALANLLANALQYSPVQAPVTVRGSSRDGWICLEVEDHGHGILAAEMDQVGTRYFRGRNALSTPGLGLGLSLVRTIATLHKGRLELESTEGQGTTIRLMLPIGIEKATGA